MTAHAKRHNWSVQCIFWPPLSFAISDATVELGGTACESVGAYSSVIITRSLISKRSVSILQFCLLSLSLSLFLLSVIRVSNLEVNGSLYSKHFHSLNWLPALSSLSTASSVLEVLCISLLKCSRTAGIDLGQEVPVPFIWNSFGIYQQSFLFYFFENDFQFSIFISTF